MLVEEIIVDYDRELITINPDDTVEAAAKSLASNLVGALPVCNQSGDLVGIISERDVVQGFAKQNGGLGSSKVSDLMSENVITCSLLDNVSDMMAIMSQKGIRHLPVMVNGRLSNIISSRDVLSAMLERTETQRNHMVNAYEMVR
jgi:CBS domain-containing protein